MSNYDKNKDSYGEDFRSGFIVGFLGLLLIFILVFSIFVWGLKEGLDTTPKYCREYGKFKYENVEYSCKPLDKIPDKTSDKIQDKP